MIDFSDPNFHIPIIKRIHWNESHEMNLRILSEATNRDLQESCRRRINWLNENKYESPPWRTDSLSKEKWVEI